MRIPFASFLVAWCATTLAAILDPTAVSKTKPVPLPFHQQSAKLARNGLVKIDEKAEIAAFEKYFAGQLQARGVPGMMYAVVRQNMTIAASGLGVLNISHPTVKVDAETLFNIGSVTKSLTGLLLGTLVDEGRLNFTSRINTVFPGFALKDPLASDRCTFVDALTHVTGLPRYDILMSLSMGDTVDEFITRLKYLEPTADFRATFQYNNLMYGVAGQAAAKLANASSYADAIKTRVFDKAGMTRAAVGPAAAARVTNVAAPHAMDRQNKTALLPEYDEFGLMDPAGGAFLSANDAAMYLRMLLNKGKAVTPTGDIVVREKTLGELFKARYFSDMSNLVGGLPQFSEDFGYAFGWFKGTFRGRRFLYHSGGVFGFITFFGVFPDDDLAIAASINTMPDALSGAAMFDLADRLFGTRDTDWVKTLDDLTAGFFKGTPKPPLAKNTKPSRPLESYVGSYRHDGFGIIKVTVETTSKEAPLKAAFPGKKNSKPCVLMHTQYDSFECSVAGYTVPISFIAADPTSQLFDKINVQLEPAVKETLFTRI